MTPDLPAAYKARFDTFLIPLASALQQHLYSMLVGEERIDRVSARAKSPDRFLGKATKKDGDNPKYDDPLNEIQDQIGARITVFYLQDVERVRQIAMTYLTAIEFQKKEPLGEAEFGYFGEHFIMRIPDDIIPEGHEDDVPEFFELQIKTLFQHAWSEADHDLGYKSVRELSPFEKRQVGFSAAQSWGADQIFRQLADELVFKKPRNGVAETDG